MFPSNQHLHFMYTSQLNNLSHLNDHLLPHNHYQQGLLGHPEGLQNVHHQNKILHTLITQLPTENITNSINPSIEELITNHGSVL